MVNPFDEAARRLAPRTEEKQEKAKRNGAEMDAGHEDQEATLSKKKKKKKMSKEATPVVEVGSRVEVRMQKGGETQLIEGVVTAVEASATEKAKRGRWVYTIASEGTSTRTRLTHHEWRRLRPHPQPAAASSRSRYLSLLERGGCKIVAPMVGGSELAFRLLCRKYGAEVAYTPMMDSALYASDPEYRRTWMQSTSNDAPTTAHFSANDPELLGRACKAAVDEHRVDAVDLNLGCPQRVAFSGHFGSYLLGDDDRGLVLSLVRSMKASVPRRVAVCVKIRLLDDQTATINLVKGLCAAGADVVAIHARKRATWHKKGPGARDGPADLDAVAAVVKAVAGDDVAIVSNGNVRSNAEATEALRITGARGVMSAEALLNDPALFSRADSDPTDLERLRLAAEYLDLAARHGNPAGYRSIAFHTRRICVRVLEKYDSLDTLLDGSSLADARNVVDACLAYETGESAFAADPAAKKLALDRKKKRDLAKQSRRRYEERMARKAKREGKPLDFYLRRGGAPPTPAQIAQINALPDHAAKLARWKQHFAQVCFNFVLNPDGCPRPETCAFLHVSATSAANDDDADLVSG